MEELLLGSGACGQEGKIIEKEDIAPLEEISEGVGVTLSCGAAVFVDERFACESDNALPGGETLVADGVE